MSYYGYICLGGVEIANESRVAAYLRSGVLGAGYNANCEECDAVVDGDVYVSPATDPAPWYDPSFFASDEFYGFLPLRIDVQTVLERQMSRKARNGGVLGRLNLRPRVVTVEGHLLASSVAGMEYGRRWLSEALSGSGCDDCGGDDLVLLPACPDASYQPDDQAFRALVNAGVVEGPTFGPRGNFPEAKINTVAFQLAAEEPYLFTLAERIINHSLTSAASVAAKSSTPEWVDGGTYVIDMTNNGLVDATAISISGRISLDGSCPVTGDASTVAPSWTYDIATLGPGDRLVIDGRRRRVTYYDASCKEASPGYHLIDFDGPWKNPDVGPCTTMCVRATIGGGNVDLDVDAHLRMK